MTKRAKRNVAKCQDCNETLRECRRCETSGVCNCCPCECEYVDPAPAARAAMKRYDAAMERREIAVDCNPQEGA